MEQSATISELAKALCKAQGQMEGAVKDSENPFFKSKYADLTSVWQAVRKPFTDNGLSIVQFPSSLSPSEVSCETMLIHSSGEWVRDKMTMRPTKTDPQSILSCLTYLRRGCLASVCGVSPEDDDGNIASGNVTESKPKIVNRKQNTNKEADVPDHDIPIISQNQVARMFALANKNSFPTDELKKYLLEKYGIMHSNEIPVGLYEDICTYIEAGWK